MVQSMSLAGLQQASRFQLNLKGWTRSGCKNDEIHALLVPPLHHHPWKWSTALSGHLVATHKLPLLCQIMVKCASNHINHGCLDSGSMRGYQQLTYRPSMCMTQQS